MYGEKLERAKEYAKAEKERDAPPIEGVLPEDGIRLNFVD